MKAILLAAGLGQRLLPLTQVLPKCLMPVAGRPLLEYWLASLARAGFDDILINTHYLPEMVRTFIDGTDFPGRTRLVHEDALLGTGGTLAANRDFAAGESVLLVHADNFCAADLGAFAAAHRNRRPGTVMTMMRFVTDRPQSCGILELDGDGVVTAFHEKVADPPGDQANAAVYIVEPEVVTAAARLGRQFVDFSTDIIPLFLGRIQTWANTAYHRDIGDVASLLAAQSENPFPPGAPQRRSDPWLRLCRDHEMALPRRLGEALALALDLPLVEMDDPLPDGQMSETDALHYCREDWLDRRAPFLENLPADKCNSLLFFEFLSPFKEFALRRRGRRFLAACAPSAARDAAQGDTEEHR